MNKKAAVYAAAFFPYMPVYCIYGEDGMYVKKNNNNMLKS